MADRMTLIMELGAMAKQAEKRGDNPGAATLRATLELLVHDQPIVAAEDARLADEERRITARREADRDRKRDARVRTRPQESSGQAGIQRTGEESSGRPQGFPGPLPNSLTTTATSTSSPHAWTPGAEADLAAKLTTDAGRTALAAVLHVASKNGGTKAGVVGEIAACLEGARGKHHTPTLAQLDVALSDYATNGLSSGAWNAAHFRACVRRAVEEPEHTASAADAPRRAAPYEHWSVKKEREDNEAADLRRIQGLVSARRSRGDGEDWWARMQRDAGDVNAREQYRYAANHLNEPASLAAIA